MTSGLKLCPTCNMDDVIKVVDCQTAKTIGFTCEWCGEEWPATPAPTVTVEGNVITLPRHDPERGGQVQ